MTEINNVIIEGSTFTNLWGNDLYTPHGEFISAMSGCTNVTIANNIIRQYEGSGAIIFDDTNNACADWNIYGNVFHLDYSDSTFGGSNGVIDIVSHYVGQFNNLRVFNNTFVQNNDDGANLGQISEGVPDGSTGCIFKNNLLWDNVNTNVDVIYDQSHNAVDDADLTSGTGEVLLTENPFTDIDAYDYTLNAAAAEFASLQDGGTSLSDYMLSPLDPNGVDRTGHWTIGAFEYAAGVTDTSHVAVSDLSGAEIVGEIDSLVYTFSKVVSYRGSIDSVAVFLSDSTWYASSADTNVTSFRIGGLAAQEHSFHLRTFQTASEVSFYKYSNSSSATPWTAPADPRPPREFFLSANSTGGVGTRQDPFSTFAVATDSLTEKEDTLTVIGEVYDSADFIAAVDSILVRSDPDPDSLAILSGKETVTGFTVSGGGGGSADSTMSIPTAADDGTARDSDSGWLAGQEVGDRDGGGDYREPWMR
ncbi:right-handed parallel beta-helix repeat-containing protein, partial [Candidatus Pacearchaeota archaeon]|nr:right-handed parallel beta-helix repeat-containing protein [Candidatus Pacearchaeota archaeon]